MDMDKPGLASPADVNASRLLKNAKVKTRLQEIAAMAAKRNEVTEDSLIEELEQARIAAIEAQQASAAVAATMGKAKSMRVTRRAERNRKTRRFRQHDRGRAKGIYSGGFRQ